MSITCGVCGTSLWRIPAKNPRWEGDTAIVDCPTCIRREFLENQLLENLETMKVIRDVLGRILTIMEHNRHGEKEG